MPTTVTFSRLPILALFLALGPATLAGHTWYVDGVHGNDNNNCQSRQHACKTITHAIFISFPSDSIFVAPATYHESLNGIPFNLKIIGSGAKTTIVDARGSQSQVVIISSEPNAQVTLSGMTFRNGGGQVDGGGIHNCPFSTLTLINTTISDNSAVVGGAIGNGGLLTIINSTLSGSVARKQRGGAIANYGTLIITNSTSGENSSGSSGQGGGILNGGLFQSAGTLFINNSTFSGNTAGEGSGGGIFNVKGSTVALQNSILASNTGGNCHGTLNSDG